MKTTLRTAGSFPLHKGTGGARIAGGQGIKYHQAVAWVAMSKSQNGADGDDVKALKSRNEMLEVCAAIAQAMYHDLDQLSESHPDRDDCWGFVVEHPCTPVEVFTKRRVSDDGWGYVYDRIHVTIAADSIGTSRIMDIKRENDLEVADVWQSHADEEADMGQHDRAAITFALEPR